MLGRAGAIVLPLELVDFEKADENIVKRTFGGMVIARDDKTAAALATSYGMSCVTLEGRISRMGSLQGGWRDTRRGNAIRVKLEYDECEVVPPNMT